MLYNRNAVKNRISVGRERYDLARKIHLFGIGIEAKEFALEVKDGSKDKTDVEIAKAMVFYLHDRLLYDDVHAVEGIRSAQEVWDERMGHCIEQNMLLYSMLRKVGIKPGLLIAKAPKDFEGSDEIKDEYGIHLFVSVLRDNVKYLADSVTGKVEQFDVRNSSAFIETNFREFVAYSFLFGAEDLSLGHDKTKMAKIAFRTALLLDPNNYTIWTKIGDMHLNIGRKKEIGGKKDPQVEYDKSENAYRRAIKMAPDIADVYKEYGDLLYGFIYDEDRAVKEYIKAAERPSEDMFLLASLEDKLIKLGMKSEAAKAKKSLEKTMKRKGVGVFP